MQHCLLAHNLTYTPLAVPINPRITGKLHSQVKGVTLQVKGVPRAVTSLLLTREADLPNIIPTRPTQLLLQEIIL